MCEASLGMGEHERKTNREDKCLNCPFEKETKEKWPQGTGHSAFCSWPPPEWSCYSLNWDVSQWGETCRGFHNAQRHSEESSRQAQIEVFKASLKGIREEGDIMHYNKNTVQILQYHENLHIKQGWHGSVDVLWILNYYSYYMLIQRMIFISLWSLLFQIGPFLP